MSMQGGSHRSVEAEMERGKWCIVLLQWFLRVVWGHLVKVRCQCLERRRERMAQAGLNSNLVGGVESFCIWSLNYCIQRDGSWPLQVWGRQSQQGWPIFATPSSPVSLCSLPSQGTAQRCSVLLGRHSSQESMQSSPLARWHFANLSMVMAELPWDRYPWDGYPWDKYPWDAIFKPLPFFFFFNWKTSLFFLFYMKALNLEVEICFVLFFSMYRETLL